MASVDISISRESALRLLEQASQAYEDGRTRGLETFVKNYSGDDASKKVLESALNYVVSRNEGGASSRLFSLSSMHMEDIADSLSLTDD